MDQLFGCCLPITSCDADHRNVELLPMIPGQLLKVLKYVIYKDIPLISYNFLIINNGNGSPIFQGLSGKAVAVKIISLKRKK